MRKQVDTRIRSIGYSIGTFITLSNYAIGMDVTTIQCGKETREQLARYRDDKGFKNYNEALRSLLQRVEE